MDINLFSKKFDHTSLKLGIQQKDIIELCDEAIKYNFYSVMVYPSWIFDCKMCLDGTDIKVGTVIGFPHGQTDLTVKEKEIEECIKQGANEVDIVLDRFGLYSGFEDQTEHEVRLLTDKCKKENVIVKFIIETCFLTDQQKIKALHICEDAGVDFVKTSTGFGSGGATPADIELLYQNRKLKSTQIKASGGIKTLEDVSRMVSAGATRLGTSSTVSIMEEYYKTNEERKSNILEMNKWQSS